MVCIMNVKYGKSKLSSQISTMGHYLVDRLGFIYGLIIWKRNEIKIELSLISYKELQIDYRVKYKKIVTTNYKN